MEGQQKILVRYHCFFKKYVCIYNALILINLIYNFCKLAILWDRKDIIEIL